MAGCCLIAGHVDKGHKINLQIGELIKKRRKELTWTQKELADKLGVTAQQIQKYEAGINSVRLEKLVQLSQVLAVPIHQFLIPMFSVSPVLNEDEEDFDYCQIDKDLSLSEVGEIFQKFLSLDKKSQKYIVKMIKELSMEKKFAQDTIGNNVEPSQISK